MCRVRASTSRVSQRPAPDHTPGTVCGHWEPPEVRDELEIRSPQRHLEYQSGRDCGEVPISQRDVRNRDSVVCCARP